MAPRNASYSAMYDRADAQLRQRPLLSAALYLKDAVHIGLSSLGGAALCVPVMWFWGAVSDLGTIQKAMATPVDSAAIWSNASALFVVMFVLLLGLSMFRGQFGRSRNARLHADAQLLFVLAVAQGTATDKSVGQPCPHCGSAGLPQ